MIRKILLFVLGAIVFSVNVLFSQIVLIGENVPYGNVNDGDFSKVKADWRKGAVPPFWSLKSDYERSIAEDVVFGVSGGRVFNRCGNTIAESKLLNTNKEYQNPRAGDILHWSFGADVEYRSNGTVSMALVFGDKERMLAERVKLIGSDLTPERFCGKYILTEEDSAEGLPFIRFYMFNDQKIKVFIDDVNVWVEADCKKAPVLKGESKDGGNLISWRDQLANKEDKFKVFRSNSSDEKSGYKLIGETIDTSFYDKSLISGMLNHYVVVRSRASGYESAASNIVTLSNKDDIAPLPPVKLTAEIGDCNVNLKWEKSLDKDISSYSIYRGDEDGNFKLLAKDITKTYYEDNFALKSVDNYYVVYAHDYSGNISNPSSKISARVKLVDGSAFSDLILPMPIQNGLRSDLWGVDDVLPRDPDNGIESKDISYWGGRPVEFEGKFHMLITYWDEGTLRGHYDWPSSKIAYTVSDNPIGPYKVVRDNAYEFKNGSGHNPDIILMNDGTYALYALIDLKPMIFTSKSMEGPWKLLGELKINGARNGDKGSYKLFRNLTGVQIENGDIIIVAKFGQIIRSDKGLLGPYDIVNANTIHQNETLPPIFRKVNYEDPVMWRDEVQFHMMINSQYIKKGIYLRSKDGINWKFNNGIAFSPYSTIYEDGTVNIWDKLERPHVITDKYGRATHLSLAVIDVPKHIDYGGDNHSSKNVIMPLRVSKRLEVVNKDEIDKGGNIVRLLVKSEDGFYPMGDVDVESLRLGGADVVDYGAGAKAIKVKRKGKDMLVEFRLSECGMKEDDFVCKLLGLDNNKELLFGFAKW